MQPKTKNNNKDDIIDFYENIATKNQSKLNITITYHPAKKSFLTDIQVKSKKNQQRNWQSI